MTRRGVTRASVWSTADVLGRQAIGFIFSIILARLLAPADFGVAALAIMCSSILIAVIQTGIVTWLASRTVRSDEQENAAFWLCLLVSLAAAIGLFALAPPLARFFEAPLLRSLVWAAAAQVVFAALGVVQTGLLTRQLAMKPLVAAGVVSTLLSGGLGVALALAGYGPLSIVAPLALNSLANSLLLWWLCPWRPALRFQFAVLRPDAGFLRNLGVSNLLEAAYGNIANALLGKFHGPYDLGIYNRAWGTQQLPGNIILMAASRVMLPVFADSRDHPERLGADVRAAIRIMAGISFPAMAVLAAAASPLIETLFGAKWLSAAPLMAILAIGGALVPLHMVNLQYMLARDRSDEYLRVEVVKKIVAIALLAIGAIWGIYGVAIAQAAYSVIGLFINARLAATSLGYGAWRQLADTLPAMVKAMLLGAVTLLVQDLLSLPAAAELLVVLLAAGSLFVLLNFAQVRQLLESRHARAA